MTTTILTLPGISSQTCKPAIEGVPAKTVTIIHHDEAPAERLVEAIEEEGYHVAAQR